MPVGQELIQWWLLLMPLFWKLSEVCPLLYLRVASWVMTAVPLFTMPELSLIELGSLKIIRIIVEHNATDSYYL